MDVLFKLLLLRNQDEDLRDSSFCVNGKINTFYLQYLSIVIIPFITIDFILSHENTYFHHTEVFMLFFISRQMIYAGVGQCFCRTDTALVLFLGSRIPLYTKMSGSWKTPWETSRNNLFVLLSYFGKLKLKINFIQET